MALILGFAALVPAVESDAAATLGTIAPNVLVTERAPGELIQNHQSPDLALHPTDPSLMVVAGRFETPDRGCTFHASHDGGTTWHEATLPPLPDDAACWAPQVAFGDDGDVYVITTGALDTGGSNGVFVFASRDGGRTYEPPVEVYDPTGFFADIAADISPDSPYRGRLYTSWYVIAPSPEQRYRALVSYSDDGGRTWSEPSFLSRPDDWHYVPVIDVGPEGNVYVAFKDIAGCPGFFPEALASTHSPSPCPIGVLRSTDGGESFDATSEVAVTLHDDLSILEQPALTVAPNGDVLVAFASLPNSPAPGCATEDVDVFVARSTDEALTWSDWVRVNDDPCTSGADQRDPWLDVAPDGRVDVVFYDERNDLDHALMDLYGASSADGGLSFSNRRVTERSFDARVMFTPKTAGLQSANFARSNAVVSLTDHAMVAWGDARNTQPNSPSGDPATSAVDLFVARLDVTGQPQRPTSRIEGNNRYTTAVAVSRATFSFATAVVIGSGETFPDALAGGPLARLHRGPMLLTPRGVMPDVVLDEVARLGPDRVVLLGGSAVISDAVVDQLAELGIDEIVRVAGENRFETAAAVAAQLGPSPSGTALIASGESFADGAAASSYASFRRQPVLFVTRDGVPQPTWDALADNDIERVLVVGGSAVVSDVVLEALAEAGYQTERIAGPDRYATAAALAERAISDAASLRTPVNVVYAATGFAFPDALSAAAAIAYRGGVLLLADADASSAGFLREYRDAIDQVVLLGGCRAGAITAVEGFGPDGCR